MTNVHLRYNYTHLIQSINCHAHHICSAARITLHWPLTLQRDPTRKSRQWIIPAIPLIRNSHRVSLD